MQFVLGYSENIVYFLQFGTGKLGVAELATLKMEIFVFADFSCSSLYGDWYLYLQEIIL